jgi:DNA adenine methylase
MLAFLNQHLPDGKKISGRFIEPFVGGGAIFFSLRPQAALLADANDELMDLYRGIRRDPEKIWRLYRAFPKGKAAYRRIRSADVTLLDLEQRAARSLYLNRTCFKGMWRHNHKGRFNVGYGGESRRWSIKRRDLFQVSRHLSGASLRCSDFEPIIGLAGSEDYLFLDPPYRPGEREQIHDHYLSRQFTFSDHKRLASSLRAADKRGVAWAMTISDHPDILKLYRKFTVVPIPLGTSRRIGVLTKQSGEVLIGNAIT